MAASLMQLVSGHTSGVGVAKNQPAKLAAFEGLYTNTPHAPLTLWGWVDEKAEAVKGGVGIPGLLSYLVYKDPSKPVQGLSDFKPEDRPPVNLSFQFYHIMVAVGFGMIAVAGLGFLYFWQGSLFEKRWLLWLLALSVLGPQIANEAGWFAAEVGRQPWIVYGLLRTPDGLSAVVKADAVLTAIVLFSLVYMLLFAVFLYLLNDKIQHGPDAADLMPSGKLAMPGRQS
jgi:cytochrome d ubiquinol oxidase subunit I